MKDLLKTSLVPLTHPNLEARWRALQSAGAVPSPFLSWQWYKALAAVPAAAGNAHLVIAERPTGEVIGLLPVEWSRGPGRLRTVGVAGWRWLSPDHLDVVAAPADRPAVAAAIVRHLSESRTWDLLDFDGLSPQGSLSNAVLQLRLPLYHRMTPEPVAVPWVDLRGTRELTSVIPSRNLRQQVSRGTRAGGGLSVITDPDAVEAALVRLMTLHNARFGAASSVFATAERRRFHVLAARGLTIDGLARIYRLGSADRSAALLYALIWDKRIFYYSMGIDPLVSRSPGLSILGASIWSAAQEGFLEFDLLRGEHAFKLRFAGGVRTDRRLRVVRPTARVATALTARAWGRISRAGSTAP